jgi:hypothetical protein
VQIRSGQAKVTAADHRVVELVGITLSDAALLAAGQAFQFAGESLLHYTIDSVLSVVVPVQVHLLNPYAAAMPFDTLADYVIWKDFTVNHGFYEVAPTDVNIRDAITQNARLDDVLVGTGGGGGGAFSKSGRKAVSSGAVSVTITPTSGVFPTPPYIILATPNWNTTVIERDGSQTTGQFIVDFSNPAPTSGAVVNWGVAV